jgi:hypothetical protein
VQTTELSLLSLFGQQHHALSTLQGRSAYFEHLSCVHQSSSPCLPALRTCRNVVALALSQRLAILPTESSELDFQSALPLDACTFPEQVTTLCWAGYAGPTSLSFRVSAHERHGTFACDASISDTPAWTDFLPSSGDSPHLQDCSLLLGTSSGYLQLHAEDGRLLHRQRIHTSQAQSIQARNSGMGEACCTAYQQVCTCQKPLCMPHHSSCLSCA